MSDLTLPQQLALAEFLATHFKTVRDETLNPAAAGEMTVGERLAVKFAGILAAWVSMPKPAERASVKDKDVFLAWAKANMPWAVETVEQVRSGTQATILRDAKANGGKWLNKETGEYVEIDGIEIKTGDPSPRVELTPEAAEAIGRAWMGGDIDVAPLLLPQPALPGGETDAA